MGIAPISSALIGFGVLAALYAAAVATLFLSQRRILFRPHRSPPDLARAGTPGVRALAVPAADGMSLLAWYLPPPRADSPLVLCLHGNAGHIGHRAYRFHAFRLSGWGVMMLEYRGYGGNPGHPSEQGLLADANAGLATVRAMGFPLSRILLWGESLGSNLAVRLATEHPVAAVLLEAPYTSITDIARRRFPFAPTRWLLRDRFDTARAIGGVRAPVLVMHGALDRIVPLAMGRAVFEAAPRPKELWIAPEAGHVDLIEAGAVRAAADFVDRTTGCA
jgi:fermentation-respiration switch protein FrsA (DUF1100 family)